MTDTDLQDRVAELEEYARHIIPAREGADGWANYFQSLLMQEREYVHALVTEVIASLQREFEATAKRIVDEAATRRIRGTYNPSSKYDLGDVVALDGGSFQARHTSPGPCPGAGWQLIARQGQRGVAGPKGERGPPGPTIEKWIVDRAAYRVTPVYSGGIFGPALELRELFEPSQDDGATR
jgi:hypothetical protein